MPFKREDLSFIRIPGKECKETHRPRSPVEWPKYSSDAPESPWCSPRTAQELSGYSEELLRRLSPLSPLPPLNRHLSPPSRKPLRRGMPSPPSSPEWPPLSYSRTYPWK